MRLVPVIVALALSACGEAPPAQDQPVDYDAMNLEAEGPAWPIAPQPVTTGELARLDLSGVTCTVPGRNHRENLFVATQEKGVMRVDSEILEFAPRPTKNPVAFDISDSFDGLSYRIDLAIDRDSETEAGPGLVFYNGQMTVRDARERIVFEHRGPIECGGQA
jgi:hypothetical protein